MDNRNVVMNPHDNLLTLEEHFYALQDVKEPNVFRKKSGSQTQLSGTVSSPGRPIPQNRS